MGLFDCEAVDMFGNVKYLLDSGSVLSFLPTPAVTMETLSEFLGCVADKSLAPQWFVINPILSILDTIRTMETLFSAKRNFVIKLPARFLFIEQFALMFTYYGVQVCSMLPSEGESMAWFIRDINLDGKVLINHVYDLSRLKFVEYLDVNFANESHGHCTIIGKEEGWGSLVENTLVPLCTNGELDMTPVTSPAPTPQSKEGSIGFSKQDFVTNVSSPTVKELDALVEFK